MQVDEFSSVDPNVDYAKILPIHQKRMIAFINHFISNTVTFLNNFAQSCESRLMEFEYKVQKLDAALLILESQLSSISGLIESSSDEKISEPIEHVVDDSLVEELQGTRDDVKVESHNESIVQSPIASQDPKFVRFFNMIQFGVPLQAVKNQMIFEGLDPTVLDRRNDAPS